MLFDWKKATPVVSLDGVIAWLETKDPSQEYNYADCRGMCFFSQYLTDRLDVPAIRPNELGRSVFDAWIALHDNYRDLACTAPWTFGAALKRAYAMRAKEFQVDEPRGIASDDTQVLGRNKAHAELELV